MVLEVLLDNKNGIVWDISGISGDLTWSTARTGTPASVNFSLLADGLYQDKAFTINNGDVIRVTQDGTNVFYGYVFSIKHNSVGEVSVKAYDQVRYLLAKATYAFKGKTATQIIQQIAAEFQLKTGRIDNSGYVLPTFAADAQSALDIIEQAITQTLISTQKHYVFFDDFGGLSLRLVDDFVSVFYIGDASLLTDFNYTRDIDSDTYNRIKLYRDNKDTGKREVYAAQDSANIAKWGVLQLYESVDEQLNEAQIKERLAQIVQLKNREMQSLKLEAIGDVRVRAGTYVPIIVDALDFQQPMLVDEAKHSFTGNDHKMTLTLKVI